MSLDKQIAEALGRAKKIPDGYQCQCPCHDDKEASMSVKITKENKLAVFCFAGCAWQDIYSELKRRNLIPDFKKGERPKTPNTPNATKEIIYSYTDENGKELFQKVRRHGKKGLHRHYNESEKKFVWNIQGVRNVLYNLPNVINSPLVFLCEGEKDCDNLNSRGLVATTNNCGAISWNDTFTPFLEGKIVVICQDNDEAGAKRTSKLAFKLAGVAKEIRLFVPPEVKEHGDVTDWLEGGGDAKKIFELSKIISGKNDKNAKATREQYFELFDRILRNPRKCIFSDKLMTYDEESALWNPCVNFLEIIRSEAAVHNETSEIKFSLSLIQPHFFAYENTKKPEFLINIPEWDGKDRISEMAYMMKLKPDAGVDEMAFSELLKEWMATAFRRLNNPMIQNRILVLQGNQGLGKDTWISMLVDGMGQFAVPLSVIKEDKDTFLNLHRGLIMKISEFDKTAKTEVSTLKDIITTPSTNLRAPYDRDSKVRYARCSFVSSANIENILRDYTGNRRFLIFEIEKIDYQYKDWSEEEKKEWQLQILAEAQYLADQNYKASSDSTESIKDYIEKKTPDDPADDTVREFEMELSKQLSLFGRPELTEKEVTEIIREIKKNTGLHARAIREQLRRKIGKYNREGGLRYWTYKTPVIN